MLPLPAHYDPATTSDWGNSPDHFAVLQQAIEWQVEHQIAASSDDATNTHLMLIDLQRDFCFPAGTLYVGGRSGRGALDDTRRVVEFIYRHLDEITQISATLDTHTAFQIFTPSFWVDRHGAHPPEHTIITTEDILSERFSPNPRVASWLGDGSLDWLKKHVLHYTRTLEREGRYTLYLWPPHCIVGSDGHVLAGAVQKARLFHAYARDVESPSILKGDNPLTEHYSALRPEVMTNADGSSLGRRNEELIQTLFDADRVIFAGQAASHCVRSTLDDLIDEARRVDPELLRRFVVLTDCMSAVAVPEGDGTYRVDFTPEVDRSFERWAEAGVQLRKSVDM